MKTVVLSMKWPSLVAKNGKNSLFPKKKSLVRLTPVRTYSEPSKLFQFGLPRKSVIFAMDKKQSNFLVVTICETKIEVYDKRSRT